MPDVLLRVEQLHKVFAGVHAVEDFSMTVYPNEIVGLIGPNGAGKSTVINLISGFHRPTSGRIWFADHEITHAASSHIARLGLVRTFQHIRLFGSLTVRQNLEAAAQARLRPSLLDVVLYTPHYRQLDQAMRAAVDEALQLFGLWELQDRPARTLAYGDQRRVEIARALVTQPRALLLDEPAAGMNDPEAAALADFLAQMSARHGLAMVIIEHHLDVIMRLCQRVIVLDYGSIIASGTPEEIVRDPAVLQAYLGETA